MMAGKRWQKAFVVSVVVHGIVLAGLGWIFAQALAVPDIPAQYIELALDGEVLGEKEGAGGAFSGGLVNQEPYNDVQVSPKTPPAYTGQTASFQAVAGNLTVESAEAGGQAGGADGTTAGGAVSSTANGTGGAGTGKGIGGGIVQPGILSQVEPVYPAQARQAGREGTVVVRIQILTNGRPGEVSVYRSSGWASLDDAAVEAVQKWRFIPAKDRDSGQAVVCYTTMPVRFRLR